MDAQFWIGLAVGLLAGGPLGMLCLALLVVGKQEDEAAAREAQVASLLSSGRDTSTPPSAAPSPSSTPKSRAA